MRKIIRSFVIHFFALWFIGTNIGGIDFGGNLQNLALGAIALSVTEMLIKPIINLLLLPFNLVTLGVFRWVSSVVTLYIATTLAPNFSIIGFTYPGLQSNLFIIPSIGFSVFTAFIIVSFLSSFISSFLFWLAK